MVRRLQPDLRGNGDAVTPGGARPRPLIARLPDGGPLGGLCCAARGGVAGGGTGTANVPSGSGTGCWRRAGVDGVEGLVLGGEDLLQRLGQILHEMEAVRDLGRLRGALLAPSAYALARSRAMTSTPGCSRSHWATGAAVRSGSRAMGWRRSRSTRIVP